MRLFFGNKMSTFDQGCEPYWTATEKAFEYKHIRWLQEIISLSWPTARRTRWPRRKTLCRQLTRRKQHSTSSKVRNPPRPARDNAAVRH